MNKAELRRIAKLLGAKSFPNWVSKSTDRVVYGWNGGEKLEQARKLVDEDKILWRNDSIILATRNGFVHEDAVFEDADCEQLDGNN